MSDTHKIESICFYALNDKGETVYILDVKNGKNCGCFCPSCHKPLIAKNNGKIKIPHFAHEGNSNCKTAAQTSLHYLAKDIFKEAKKFSFIKFNGNIVTYNITNVTLESKDGDLIPDIVLDCDGKKFFVEIYVTHKLDEEKKEKIKERRVSTIEYDLSKMNRNITKEELRIILLKTPKIKIIKGHIFIEPPIRWLYDADLERIKEKQNFIFENGEELEVNNDIVCCPLIPKYQICHSICKECTFYGGEIGKGKFLCGEVCGESLGFGYATLIGKNEVMTNTQEDSYIDNFLEKMIRFGKPRKRF